MQCKATQKHPTEESTLCCQRLDGHPGEHEWPQTVAELRAQADIDRGTARRHADLIGALQTSNERLRAQYERWQGALDSFEQASAVACADAEKAEAEAKRLRKRVTELEGALRCLFRGYVDEPDEDALQSWPVTGYAKDKAARALDGGSDGNG